MNEAYVCISSQGPSPAIFVTLWPCRPLLRLTGMMLSIEVPEIIGLINFYDND